MGNLNATLEIGKSTLLNTQVMIQTTAHNIANADNKAYARQKTVPLTNQPYQGQEGWVGMGTNIASVIQQRDLFIEKRLTDSISKEAMYKTTASELSNVEQGVMDDGEHGLSQAMGTFWNSWETLNQNPNDLSQKTVVTQATQNLASNIRDTYNNLVDAAQSVDTQLTSVSDQANTLLTSIAGYNTEIKAAELGGQPANDLRDTRYKAITELAAMLPIKSDEQADGSVTLTMQDNGVTRTMVSGNQAGALQYDNTTHLLSYTDYQANSFAHTSFSGGSIEGLLDVYTSIGTSQDVNFVLANPTDPSITYMDRLNAFAASLITNVNTTNSAGGGSNVFDPTGAFPATFKASDISVNAAFVPNTTQALNMTDLQDQTVAGLGGFTLGGYLSDIQQRIGIDNQNASSQSDFQGALRQQLETQQQSISGVSMDEEMVNMLQQQQVYQAAAKIIQTTASMLNTVIQMVP